MEFRDIDSYLLSLRNLAKSLNLGKKLSDHNDDFDKYLTDTNLNFYNIKSKSSVEEFKQNLLNLGAAGFLSYLNQSKIEEKIAAKKEELINILGLDEEGLKNKSNDEILELKNTLYWSSLKKSYWQVCKTTLYCKNNKDYHRLTKTVLRLALSCKNYNFCFLVTDFTLFSLVSFISLGFKNPSSIIRSTVCLNTGSALWAPK